MPAKALGVDLRTLVDIGSVIDQLLGDLLLAVLDSHMQQRCARQRGNREPDSAQLRRIDFGVAGPPVAAMDLPAT